MITKGVKTVADLSSTQEGGGAAQRYMDRLADLVDRRGYIL